MLCCNVSLSSTFCVRTFAPGRVLPFNPVDSVMFIGPFKWLSVVDPLWRRSALSPFALFYL
jgi:hypothetical protein